MYSLKYLKIYYLFKLEIKKLKIILKYIKYNIIYFITYL